MTGRPFAITSGASASASMVLPAPSTPSMAIRMRRSGCNAAMAPARRSSSASKALLTPPPRSQHARQHAIWRLMVVEEGSDVDDHLLAHVDAAFDGGRAHMRQQRHLAGLAEPHQLWIDRRLVLVDVEAGAADL